MMAFLHGALCLFSGVVFLQCVITQAAISLGTTETTTFDFQTIPVNTQPTIGMSTTTIDSHPDACLIGPYRLDAIFSSDALNGSCTEIVASSDVCKRQLIALGSNVNVTFNRSGESLLRFDWNQGKVCLKRQTTNLFNLSVLLSYPYNGDIRRLQMNITFVNVNDPPRFHPVFFNVTVPENIPIGSLIGNFTVTDVDINDTVYSIRSGDTAPFFNTFQHELGFYGIRVVSELDYETHSTLRFTLTALDSRGLSGNMSAIIYVDDVNDNIPECTSPEPWTIAPSQLSSLTIIPAEYCNDLDQNTSLSFSLVDPTACRGDFIIYNGAIFYNREVIAKLPLSPCYLTLNISDGLHTINWTVSIKVLGCNPETDITGVYWPATNVNTTFVTKCLVPLKGHKQRFCSPDGVFMEPVDRCISSETDDLLKEAQALFSKDINISSELVEEVVGKLANLTGNQTVPLSEGDLDASVTILTTLSVFKPNSSSAARKLSEGFFTVVDNLIGERNSKPWQSLIVVEKKGAETVLAAVDEYTSGLSAALNGTFLQITKDSLLVEIGSTLSCAKDIQFPTRNADLPEWTTMSKNQIDLQCTDAVIGVKYSSAYYRNLTSLVSPRYSDTLQDKNLTVNSAVMSFSLYGQTTNQLPSPIDITFEIVDKNQETPVCSYWDSTASNGSGQWNNEGCSVKSADPVKVVCSCNHLTNFALLMSPSAYKISEEHSLALSIISIVGCCISILSLAATVILHAVFWKYVKSDRSIILMHLCVTLVIAYILFLAGVNNTEDKTSCTVVAVALHYIYLVVFLLMLAEGVILAAILFVLNFESKKTRKVLLLMAWGGPIVIVGISMAATKLEGYGGSTSCWLSVTSGLIWAFIVPALIIILINIGIIVAVMVQTNRTVASKKKSDREKARTGARNMCILLPIMGCTWVFGVFSVSEGQIGFQYAFATLNSLQGLFIFIAHCLLNKKMREGWRKTCRKDRGYRATQSHQSDTQTTSAKTTGL